MRLLEFFHDYPPQTNPNPFRPKGTWTPPPHRDAALDTFLDAVEHDLFNVTPAPVRDNLTTRERHALKRLNRRNEIVIKSADKGTGTVVMDRNWYIDECLRRFNEHRRTVDKQTNRSKPTTVSEHFLSSDHNASDMLLILLELIKSNRDSVRKAREAYLIVRGQTLEPLGLNRRDET